MFNHRYLFGYVIGLIAMAAAVALLFGPVNLDGYAVPDNLSQLTQQAQEQGDAFKPPASVSATCVLMTDVSAQQLNDIKKVTSQAAMTCDVESDSLDSDAVLGALAFLAVALAVFGLYRLAQSNHTVGTTVLIALIVTAVFVGAFGDDPFRRWLDDNDVAGVIFWRGFLAAAAIALGALAAHEVYRRQDQQELWPGAEHP